MPRWSKLLLGAVAALALLVGGAWLGLSLAFPPERLAALLSTRVSQATGRDFDIQGKLSFRLLPRVAVVAENLVLGNAAWGSRKDMLRVKRAALDLELWPLLQGRVDIGSVSLDGVDLLLETDRNGQGNWVMNWAMQGRDAAADSTDTSGSAQDIDLEHLQLADVHMAYRDAGSEPQAFELQSFDIRRDGEKARLAAKFTLKTQAWQLAGQTGRITALLANTAAWPFDLQLTGDGARLAAKGQWLPATRSATAEVSGNINRASVLAPWLANPASVPMPIELKTSVNGTPRLIRAEALQLSLADQRLTGRLSASLSAHSGGPWAIDAQLASPSIDLARWLPKAGGGIRPAGAERRWLFDDRPLPFKSLPQATVNMTLAVQRLRLPHATEVAALNTRLSLQGGRLAADPLSFNIVGGSVRGSVKMSPASQRPAGLQLQFDAKDLSVDALSQAVGNSGYLQGGRMQLHANLNMAGASPRALAASANGEVLLQLAGTTLSGELSPTGPNLLAGLLRAITQQSKVASRTTISCAVVRLPLKAGVAAIDRSIAVETDQLNISASGEVNLRDETLRLAFRPHAKKALNLDTASLASLVLLKGPLLDPKFSLDAAGAAGLALSLGAAGATGGLSLLAERLFRQSADPQPCHYALTGTAGTDATPRDRNAPPATPTPVSKVLPDLLRQIFK
jgi:uncharacterized protein involved in outer membrane biogenesis